MDNRSIDTQTAVIATPRRVRRKNLVSGGPGAAISRGVWWTIVLVLTLIPILYLLLLSFTPKSLILSGEVLPERLTLDNWGAMWDRMDILRYAGNSIVAALLGCLISLAIAFFVAYAIARYRTGGGFLPMYVLAGFLAPPIVAVVPLFFLLRGIGLTNSPIGLALVYGLVNVAVATALLEPFIERIPLELEEAAQLDGVGPLRALMSVVLPLVTPGLVATGIILVILNYNELLFALATLQKNESQTLPVAISLFQGDRGVQFGQMAAASIAAMVPVYVGAVFMQRYLVGGLTSGAIK